MTPSSNISVETPIQCSPDDFYLFFSRYSFLLKVACVSVVKDIKLVDGTINWIDVAGSTKQLSINTSQNSGDNLERIKYKVENIDPGSKKIIFNVLEGPMRQWYTSLKFTLEVTTSNTVKWTIEYVKDNPASEEPVVYIGLFAKVNYGVSDYIVNSNNNFPPPQRA